MKTKIAAVRSSGGVRRFHTHRVICEDTVAAHSWGVAVIVDMLYNHNPPVHMLQAAIYHDMSEHRYGDIPSPSKRWLDSEKLRAAEDEYVTSIGFPNVKLNCFEKSALKVADNFDGFMFCVDEYYRGNKTLVSIANTYYDYMKEVILRLQSYTYDDEGETLSKAYKLLEHMAITLGELNDGK